jgi:hypothetical protein
MKSNYLLDRGGDVWATTTPGAHAPSPKSQIQAVIAAHSFDCLGLLLESVSALACPVPRNPPLTPQQSIRLHSMPIALMAGGAG